VKDVGRGHRMGTTELKIWCYADDDVVIAENEDNLQQMLFQAAKKYNLISLPKTNSMIDDTMQVGTKRPTNQTSDERDHHHQPEEESGESMLTQQHVKTTRPLEILPKRYSWTWF